MKKRKAMYVIDKKYHFLYGNEYFHELYPNIKKGDICYKCITNIDHPCSECPMRKENYESTLYNLVKGEWVSAQAIDMDYKAHKDCTAIVYNVWKENRNLDEIKSNLVEGVINSVSNENPNQGVMAVYYEEGYPIFYANQYLIDMMGYNSYDEFMKSCEGKFINAVHESYINDINRMLTDTVYDGMVYNFSYKIKQANGNYLDVLEKGQVVTDENGNLVIISILTDLAKFVYSKSFSEVEYKTLDAQNQLLRYVNEELPGGYHRCKADEYATIIDVSPKFLELIKFTREEIETIFHNQYIRLVYPADVNIIKDVIHKIEAGDKASEIKYRIINKEKGYIWVKDTSQKCEFHGTEFVQSIILDITDEMNKQLELESQNRQLSLINENIPCGFKTLYDDSQFTFCYVSKECANLFGYTIEEFYEKTHGNSFGFCLEIDLPKVTAQLNECFKNNRSNYRIQFRVKCKDGSIKRVIDCGKKGINEAGQAIFYSYCLDITEGEENKDLIALQNRLLDKERERIVEKDKSIQQMELIYTLSKDFNTVYYMNIYTEEIKYLYSREPKYTKEDIEKYYKDHTYSEGINQFINNHVYPEDQDKVRQVLSIEAIREKIVDNNFLLVKYRRIVNGEPVYYETKVARVGGGLSNYVIIGYKNVDEETRQELKEQEVLADALNKAQEANRAKTIFLNNMSHDIRTPMNAIIGYSKLALNNLDYKEKTKNYLEKIGKSSNHLLSLINDVLDMSRIESGKMKLDNQPYKISTIIHDIMGIVESDVKTKSLHFLSEAINVVHDDVYCDKLRISQILLNLLSNSMKFTSYGGYIYLRIIEIPSQTKDKASFEIHVKDTGIGMSQSFIEHLFEPFVRAETSTVSGTVGTGLGMAITKNIVDMLEGSIKVNSKEGIGTEFIINFDLKVQDLKRDPKLDKYKGYRAFVVEDRLETCKSDNNILKELGIRSDCDVNAINLFDKAKQAIIDNDPYKIFIINCSINRVDSADIIKSIKSLDYKEPPVIILNGYEWIDIDKRTVDEEHIEFISKPMFISDISKVLIKHQDEEEEKQENIETHKQKLFKDKRILLVEDNEFNQEIACEILKAAGFIVDTANNGKIAINTLLDKPNTYYDLVLMDIQMPVMDGYDATKYIRNNITDEVIKNIPIIAMTANAFSEDKTLSLEAGMNDYLTKPIEVDKLFTILENILKAKNR